MRIIFTEEDACMHIRARCMRGGLIKNYHKVKAIADNEDIPDTDILFHGISHLPERKNFSNLYKRLENFKGKLVLFQNNDELEFNVERVPESLINKAVVILKAIWPSDNSKIHPLIRNKTGFLNPFLKPDRAIAGKDLKKRSVKISFYGAATSFSQYTRVEALRMLRNAGIPFEGGLCRDSTIPVEPPEDLLKPSIKKNDYLSLLGDTQISLALHGYNPLTFRLFESFSRRCLVIAQDLSDIRFVDCGLKPGLHYVSVKKDLSDLVERTRYYIEHLDEAQKIADAGFNHFRKYFQYRGVDLPQPLYKEIVKTWTGIDIKQGAFTPMALGFRLILPLIHSL
jgi:hypothetical protein